MCVCIFEDVQANHVIGYASIPAFFIACTDQHVLAHLHLLAGYTHTHTHMEG